MDFGKIIEKTKWNTLENETIRENWMNTLENETMPKSGEYNSKVYIAVKIVFET